MPFLTSKETTIASTLADASKPWYYRYKKQTASPRHGNGSHREPTNGSHARYARRVLEADNAALRNFVSAKTAARRPTKIAVYRSACERTACTPARSRLDHVLLAASSASIELLKTDPGENDADVAFRCSTPTAFWQATHVGPHIGWPKAS